jgi:hypothetical protein
MDGVSTALLVPLTVVVGDEDLLVSRAVSAVVRAAGSGTPTSTCATSLRTSCSAATCPTC